MAFLQVNDILHQAAELRQFMAQFAERHEQRAGDDFVEGLYDVIGKHADRLGTYLLKFQEEAPDGLLETWIQYPGVDALEKAIADLSSADFAENDVVLEQIIKVNQAMVDLIDQAIAQVESPRLEELLGNLKNLEDHHLREVSSVVSEADQMLRKE